MWCQCKSVSGIAVVGTKLLFGGCNPVQRMFWPEMCEMQCTHVIFCLLTVRHRHVTSSCFYCYSGQTSCSKNRKTAFVSALEALRNALYKFKIYFTFYFVTHVTLLHSNYKFVYTDFMEYFDTSVFCSLTSYCNKPIRPLPLLSLGVPS